MSNFDQPGKIFYCVVLIVLVVSFAAVAFGEAAAASDEASAAFGDSECKAAQFVSDPEVPAARLASTLLSFPP